MIKNSFTYEINTFRTFFKVGHPWPLLIYFRLFNTVDNKQVNKQMFNKIFADDWS